MSILNIAGYKFTVLNDLDTLRPALLKVCEDLGLRGTILLSHEGINLNLAGPSTEIAQFKAHLSQIHGLDHMTFRESLSDTQPFKRMKVKLKKEIITMRQPEVDSVQQRAKSVTPETFKTWLDEKRDLLILDVRNDYEFRFGTFSHAVNLHLNNFTEFPAAIAPLDKSKTIVMFCTGGIRCEKAALYMDQAEFPEVYQLEGGILNYFAKVGGDHYEGDCFVFDERIAVDPQLNETHTRQCSRCQGPIKAHETDNVTTLVCSNCE